jgi:hypothetical protein
MATGGIFQLITNDGKQDRMLMASALLKQRIEEARNKRINSGSPDCTPTLYDIERTHILFTNAHFKPFAAIGYEYNKVNPSAGTSLLGSSITFSIPQFGDFFNDMIVHAVISQPVLDYTTSNVSADISDRNLMKWCSYPGERLLKNVKFEVNGNPLDEYSYHATNFHREFHVQPNKQIGWNRCMGQEEVELGCLDQPNWANNGVESSSVSSRLCVSSTSGNQTPTGQKPTNSDGDLELFIPLLFWCNKDPRLSVPSVAIPYGQRFISIELASQDELVNIVGRGVNASDPYSDNAVATGGGLASSSAKLQTIELYINNIFVNPEVHNIFIKRIGFTLIRVHRKQISQTEGGDVSVLLQNLKWPIEALYIGVRPISYDGSDVVKRRQHLSHWHSFSKVTKTKRLTQGWQSNKITSKTGVKIEDVFSDLTVISGYMLTVAATAGVNTPATLTSTIAIPNLKPGSVLTWVNGSSGDTAVATIASINSTGLTITLVEKQSVLSDWDGDELVTANPLSYVSLSSSTPAEVSSVVDVCTPTVESISIKAHGIHIYNKFPAKFYNAYIPYNYGGPNIRTPIDCGAMLVTFCLYPGTYQPSGHINVSRAREFYIDFITTSAISSNEPGNLIVIASAINFLLISDGSAVLRYST